MEKIRRRVSRVRLDWLVAMTPAASVLGDPTDISIFFTSTIFTAPHPMSNGVHARERALVGFAFDTGDFEPFNHG
jgi:hypothetical protein